MKNKIQKIIIFFIVCFNSSFAQFDVKGRIVDCEGLPVPFAQIVDSIKNKGTKANVEGYFELKNTDSNSLLIIKALGYPKKKIILKNSEFLFVKMIRDSSKDRGQILIKKPIIYLCPTKKTNVIFKVKFKGKLGFTYPLYKDGWNITCFSNGTFINKDDNKKYSYLFWDGEMDFLDFESNKEKGFVIHKDSIVTFLQKTLLKLGLKSNEIDDFIVFWTPYLMKNEWNLINFKTGKEYNDISENTITPKPETQIRVFMSFKKTDKDTKVQPQEFATPKRNGFTIVEWGGAEQY